MMFFNGLAHYDGTSVGVVFVSPQRQILPYSFVLSERCSNNVAEYQALIINLQMAIEMKITSLEICEDSKLVINQLLALYEVKSDDLVLYFHYATQLMKKFERISLVHIPRKENQMAYALANLAASLTLLKDETIHVPLCHKWVLPPSPILRQQEVNATSVFTIDSEDWRQPLIDYLEQRKLPDELKHRTEIRRRAPRFIYYKETLYRRSFDGALFGCLRGEEANQAIEEAHFGICGAH